MTLDNFYIKDPALIKMDIEGAEVEALRGAQNLLKLNQVNVLIEIHPLKIEKMYKNGLEQLRSLLKKINYKIELCKNHRGEHRGEKGYWEETTLNDLIDFCYKQKETKNNFVIPST